MPGPLARIKSRYGGLSEAQRRLADYILSENNDETPFLSVRQLAREAGVSVASISRFARALGYASFRDFKTALGKESISAVKSVYRAISPDDGDQDIVEKVFAGNIKSLEDTLRALDGDDLARAARLVAGASRVVFFGMGSSGNIGRDAALRFSQLDIEAHAYVDSYQMLNQALRMKKGDVAVGISQSGRSAMTVKALELASHHKAATIGISGYLNSPLHKASDIFLCTSFPERRLTVASLSALVAQVCLIDALYLLAVRHRKASLESAEQMNVHTEKMLRLPAK